MEDLLQQIAESWAKGKHGPNVLSKKEQVRLREEHLRHFRRRLERLPPEWFPQRDKSRDAVDSLGDGACGSFYSEALYDGEPAFVHTVSAGHPYKGFLYRWRTSATIDYLKRHGSYELRVRLNTLRNVRIRLREAFRVVGRRAGEQLWWFRDEVPPQRDGRFELNIDAVPALPSKRVSQTVVSTILRAQGAPLTRSELATVILRLNSLETPPTVSTDDVPLPDDSTGLSDMLEHEISEHAQRFFSELGEMERKVLIARGYGADSHLPKVSFREVAQELGKYSPEYFRLMERRIIFALGTEFPVREEAEIAVRVLVDLIGAESLNEK